MINESETQEERNKKRVQRAQAFNFSAQRRALKRMVLFLVVRGRISAATNHAW